MKIGLLGDVALIGRKTVHNKNIYKELELLKNIVSQCDYCVANLEAPFTEEVKSRVCKSMHLRSDMENVEILKYLGINAVSLANNHTYDFGKRGLDDCKNVLEQNGIHYFGVSDIDEAINMNGNKIRISGFCCYSTRAAKYSNQDFLYGAKLLSKDNIVKQLEKDAKEGYTSILYLHWGDEHTNYPKIEHVNLIRELSKQYRFTVIGHHPHVIQTKQVVNGNYIAYSLGNCIFDDCQSLNKKISVVRNEENKKGMATILEFENSEIQGISEIGFYDSDEGIISYSLKEIDDISEKMIMMLHDIDTYNRVRHEQINGILKEKFGKHDVKWLLERLNYNAIGARMDRRKYDWLFEQEFKEGSLHK